MSSRLRCLSETLANVAGEPVQTRLARLMFWLCARYGRREGDSVVMNVHITHQEIADMVGTSRQTVTTVLSTLKRQGVLSIDNRRIHIESEELLNELTNGS